MSRKWLHILSVAVLFVCLTIMTTEAAISDDDTNMTTPLRIFGYLPVGMTEFTNATKITAQEYEDDYLSPFEHLCLSMPAKDDTVDIYCFPSYNGLSHIKEKMMYVDLRESDLLSEMSLLLYPPILTGMQDTQGQLAAWPLSVLPVYCIKDANDDLLHEYGLSYPQTFTELLDMIPDILSSEILLDNNLSFSDVM